MADCRYGTCDITSGRLTTKGKFAQAYGKFEARIRVPEGKATLPAFWMMGDNDEEKSWPGNGEIDAMEVAAIFIEMPPDEPQWAAVRDRLRRATREFAG